MKMILWMPEMVAVGRLRRAIIHAPYPSCYAKQIWTGTVLSALLLAPSSYAEIYTWTDKESNVQFSDTPPTTGKAKIIRPPVRPASHCTLLMDEIEAWAKDARPWLRKAREAFMSRDRKGLEDSAKKVETEQGLALESKIHVEGKKCMDGDADACKCMQNIDDKFARIRREVYPEP